MKIFNLTQRAASAEQIAAGVIVSSDDVALRVKQLMTFDYIPSRQQIWVTVETLTDFVYAAGCDAVLIDCPPFLIAPLERALIEMGLMPLYELSVFDHDERVVKHVGFVG